MDSLSKIENEAGIIRANAMRFCLLLYVTVEKAKWMMWKMRMMMGEDVQVAEEGKKRTRTRSTNITGTSGLMILFLLLILCT